MIKSNSWEISAWLDQLSVTLWPSPQNGLAVRTVLHTWKPKVSVLPDIFDGICKESAKAAAL